MSADLLIELGTEELPPKSLKRLSEAFSEGILEGLREQGFELDTYESYATPRRLAVLIKDVPDGQPDRKIERKGPSVKAAFDAEGKPTKAVIGFARSCGVEPDQLEQVETDKGAWLYYHGEEAGKKTADLIGATIDRSITRLPIPKRMRWGNRRAEFVRPVHWLVVLHGRKIIDCEVLGIHSGRRTSGHRFHCRQDFELATADEYAATLQGTGKVVASFEARKNSIREQVEAAATEAGGHALIDEELLDEVTALNEWPVAVAGGFDSGFLEVPAAALIKTMQDNQKYFPIVDDDGELKNAFITISNIDSKNMDAVRMGNERVIRPRLADAKFFWEQDQKKPLDAFGDSLVAVVFQSKLGTLADKTARVASLCEHLAEHLGADPGTAKRAAMLSKCDLMTDMVGEFASLQGTMGRLYAMASGEPQEVADAIDEQYMPRGAGSETATTKHGQILSISDKLDTLVGIFAIGQKPTGEKDPFALRRASLGILRTIIERELELDLVELIHLAADGLKDKADAGAVRDDVYDYVVERLRAYYLDKGISPGVFDAVSALRPARPLDFDRRIHAVTAFDELPEAESLAAANKRVGNILKREEAQTNVAIDPALFEEDAERALYDQLLTLGDEVEPLFDDGEYEQALRRLSSLREPVDAFFDQVMVMADDEAIKNNRIALLRKMSTLFLRAADLSRLQ